MERQNRPMPKDLKPIVRLKPSSYQLSKAELEEEVRLDATPQELLQAVVRDVKIERVNIG